ncbi:MAG: AmmeMemoRadiSam system protein B [Spirochaetales bacterium]|nr:AmmeMemoRadiSam system protein B [Spirochaetales bacterium]
MSIRPPSLPSGWYPHSPNDVKSAIEEFQSQNILYKRNALAGMVPHAGWFFSGQLACDVIGRIKPDYETICIVGGHLPQGDKILAAKEQWFETPLGAIENNHELLQNIRSAFSVSEDNYHDNTVEIQLPLVKHFFPHAKILWLRVSPSKIAIELGQFLAQEKSASKMAVIGSTDLTHYGPNYQFTPKGQGPLAIDWVKNTNDKGFISHILNYELSEALDHANSHYSACSAGGAVCAAAFAKEMGIKQGQLLSYASSYDKHPSSSFVGYGAIIFEK